MPVSQKNVRLAVTVDKDTAKKVEELAATETRSNSAMLSILIKEALQARDKK